MCHGQMLSDAMPKARKAHRCDVCDEPIAAGTVYYRQSGIQEGEMVGWKAHERCQALLWAADDDDGCIAGHPSELITEATRANWRWMRAEARRGVARLRERFKPKV